MRVYVAGPIAGPTDESVQRNIENLAVRAARWRALGHDPVNPAELNGVGTPEQRDRSKVRDYIRADIIAMLGCDAVAIPSGWSRSRGTRLEVFIAGELGLEILMEESK